MCTVSHESKPTEGDPHGLWVDRRRWCSKISSLPPHPRHHHRCILEGINNLLQIPMCHVYSLGSSTIRPPCFSALFLGYPHLNTMWPWWRSWEVGGDKSLSHIWCLRPGKDLILFQIFSEGFLLLSLWWQPLYFSMHEACYKILWLTLFWSQILGSESLDSGF